MPIKHTIAQGDSTTSLAEQYGFFAKTVWDHADNAELKGRRKDMNVLMPGDVLTIPDKRPKELAKPDARLHKFRRKGVPALFRLQLFDLEKPRAGQKYRLVVDGLVLQGTTDERGVLEQSIPTGSKSGEIIVGPDEFRITFQFGHLDPLDEISGIQKRLNNLGYYCGEPDGELTEETQLALTAFQKRYGLKETGQPDKETVDQLAKLHDAPHDIPKAKKPPAGGAP